MKRWLSMSASKRMAVTGRRISRVLAKKKIHKSVNQIKNFSFNVARSVRQITGFDNHDVYKKIPTDARELMMVIASMEWRKRTTNKKYHNDCLRELLFEGSTSYRFQKNKLPILIEMPSCPSLSALFTTEKRVEKFPADVTIQLEPFTNGDQSTIASAMLNPFLKVKMGINERLSRLFELLQVKWGTPLKHLVHYASTDDHLNFCLFVHRDVDVGNVFFTEAHSTPSLKRLLSEHEKLENMKNVQKGHFSCDPLFTVSTRTIDCPLLLRSEVLRAGLTGENCGDASLAELFCVCGLQPVIRLMYHVTNRRDHLSTWEIFADLIKRDYPECLSNSKENRPKVAAKEMSNKMSQQTQTENCFLTNVASNREIDMREEGESTPTAKRKPSSYPGRKETPKSMASNSSSTNVANSISKSQPTSSKIVDIENEQFLAQLQALEETSRKTPLQRGAKRPATGSNEMPTPTIASISIPMANERQQNSPHTDFSSMKAPSDRWISGRMARKSRSPQKKKQSPPKKQQMQESALLMHHDETARHAINQSDELHPSALEIQCFGEHLQLSQSPNKSISSFPMDFRGFSDGERMCAQVLNQNSIDFYSHFQQFVESFDQSPQKSQQQPPQNLL